MLELKRESMSVFISNARAEIEYLWDELILGDEERGSFAPFVDGEQGESIINTSYLTSKKMNILRSFYLCMK
jgi:Ase1/PRC1/MAP65 family protein